MRQYFKNDTPWPIQQVVKKPQDYFEPGLIDKTLAEREEPPLLPTDPKHYELLKSGWLVRYRDNSQAIIGGFHILENAATMMEWPAPQKLKRMFEDSRLHEYLVLWGYWTQETMGFENADAKRLRTTFLAILDLSLFCPLGPVYGRLRSARCCWYDVQPGWRFLMALQCVSRLGPIDDEHSTKAYQEAVCARLDWPKPSEFLALGAALSCESHQLHYLRHRDACKARLNDHSAFLFDFSDQQAEFFRRHPPILNSP